MAHLVSFNSICFFTNVNEKCKSISHGGIQVKNRRKTISIEEKLEVISRLEKGEQIADICCNVRIAYSSIHIVCDDADKIKESTKSGIK
jgi:hypothetical protein